MSSPNSPNPSEFSWIPPCSEDSLRDYVRRRNASQLVVTDKYYLFPEEIMSDAGKVPDPWQLDLLRMPPRGTLLLCSRQSSPSLLCAAQNRRPSSRGRRGPGKSGASVWNAGGGI
jgi:hypothetical protein